MDMAYKVPDYGSLSPVSGKKQKMKEVYPELELKGECAIAFLKAHPNLKLGQELNTNMKLVVRGMKRAEKLQKSGADTVSDYDNCVTFEIHTCDTGKEEDMNEEGMPSD